MLLLLFSNVWSLFLASPQFVPLLPSSHTSPRPGAVKLLTEEFFATHLAALVQSPATQKQAPLLKATAHQVAAVLRRLEQALEEGQPLAVCCGVWARWPCGTVARWLGGLPVTLGPVTQM